jgi:hypothetical protein
MSTEILRGMGDETPHESNVVNVFVARGVFYVDTTIVPVAYGRSNQSMMVVQHAG